MEEIHKTEQKIADLQQYLKGLHAALKQEEDNEMIKSIRGMKLDSHALHDLLNGIQEGTVKFQVSQESEEEGTGSFVFTEKKEEGHPYGEMEKLNKKVAGVLLGVMVLFPHPQQPLHMWIRRQRRQIQKQHRRRRCRTKKQKSRQMRGFCQK